MRLRPPPRALAAVAAAAASLALAPAAGAAASRLGTWDKGDQRAVVRAGLLGKLGSSFHGERPITAGALSDALAQLAADLGTDPAVAPLPDGQVTITQLDRALVEQLGLSDLAAAVQAEAKRAGLRPPDRFGTEVVARQLGLRFNHPARDDAIEPFPDDPATRAEAAYSLARVRSFDGSEVEYAREVLERFQLPAMNAKQRRVLRLAVSKIGWPYIWGGESDTTYSDLGGSQLHGGYDCSGFVWRLFKLSGNPAGAAIHGRTAAQQAGEIPHSKRIRPGRIRPGDLLFFGSAKFHGRATEASIWHEGIALSRDFMIHASSEGVYVAPLWEAWRVKETAWARRVL